MAGSLQGLPGLPAKSILLLDALGVPFDQVLHSAQEAISRRLDHTALASELHSKAPATAVAATDMRNRCIPSSPGVAVSEFPSRNCVRSLELSARQVAASSLSASRSGTSTC